METEYPCLFCCKVVTDPPERQKKIDEGDKFVALLGKFIGQPIFVSAGGNTGGVQRKICGGNGYPIGHCVDCHGLAKTFCDQFERWERLQMETLWTMKRIVEIVRVSGRVPSRKQELQQYFTGKSGIDLRNFLGLRKSIQTKCNAKLSKSVPRVRLKIMSTSNASELKQESPTTNTFPVSHFLLGWALTHAAVTLLASEYPVDVGSGQSGGPQISQSISNDLPLVTQGKQQDVMDQYEDEDFNSNSNQASPVSDATMESDHNFPDNPEITTTYLGDSPAVGEQKRNTIGKLPEAPAKTSEPVEKEPEVLASPVSKEAVEIDQCLVDHPEISATNIVHSPPTAELERETVGEDTQVEVWEKVKIEPDPPNEEVNIEGMEQEEDNFENPYEAVPPSPNAISEKLAISSDQSLADDPPATITDNTYSLTSQNNCSPTKDPELETTNPVKSEMNQFTVKTEVNPILKPYTCEFCGKMYKRKYVLISHIRQKHPQDWQDKNKTTNKFSCKICKRSFTRFGHLRNHILHSRMHQFTKILLHKNKQQSSESVQEKPGSDSPALVSNPVPPEISQTETVPSSRVTKISSSKMSRKPGTSHHQYSLRGSRKRCYTKVVEDQNNCDPDYQEDQDSLSSSSSYDSDSADEDHNVKPDIEPMRSIVKLIRPYCRQDGCTFLTRSVRKHRTINIETAEEHKKLHQPGRYQCKFCEKVEGSIFRLSNHEKTQHSRRKIRRKSRTGVYCCPRCPYESRQHIAYENHFAEVHIGRFDSRRGRKCWTKCEICQLHIFDSKRSKDNHSNEYHTITNEDTIRIKCSLKRCSAYFLKDCQREEHERIVHGILSKTTQYKEKGIQQQAEDEIHDKVEVYTETQMPPRFVCKWCGAKFAMITACLRHQRKFHLQNRTNFENRFVCPIVKCTETFKTAKDIKSHQKLHGEFVCKVCETVLDYAPDLAIHEAQHKVYVGMNKRRKLDKNMIKRQQDTGKLTCSRCPKRYPLTWKNKFVNHFLTEHLQLGKEHETGKHCQICNAWVPKHIPHHRRTYHNIKNVPPEEVRHCELCTAYFLKCRQLIIHKCKEHWNDKCPDCGVTFKHKREPQMLMRRHLEQKHPERLPHLKFPCKNVPCFRKFATQKELDEHLAEECMKNMRKPEVCDQCGKEFKNLYIHIYNVHAQQRSFVCEQCGKGFKTKLGLTFHQEFHKKPEEWKWECEECGRKCATKQKLQQHQRTHTKEKPFVCQYCGEKYAHRHNWINHVKFSQ